jgi:hypothetical protein
VKERILGYRWRRYHLKRKAAADAQRAQRA